LKKWASRTGAGVFRLYDRDIPEVPLVLDFYGDAAQIQDAALAGALYKRPYEKDEADESQWLSAMKEAATSVLQIAPDRFFLKQRQRQRGVSQYEKINNESFTKIVSEGSLSFKVNLSDYLDTGLFPDRRLLRAMVREESSGKRMLNLFSYTGSFSVYAAAGGAASTDSIDLSNTYQHWARENFSLNGFSANLLQQYDFFSGSQPRQSCANKLIRADALDFLGKAASEKLRWDIIVLDPPAFSNSAKMTESFDLQRDMLELLQKCIKLLAPGGKIFLSVNARRFSVAAERLQSQLSVSKSAVNVTELTAKTIDEDFRGRKMPASFLICHE
jgi:23S rRNA G2069 N7-methylase RlmK/C1962 C5-methylase RlmI